MKTNIFKWLISLFKASDEKQINKVVADFQRAKEKLEIVSQSIESKIADEERQIEELKKSIDKRSALAVKNGKIQQNFRVLLAED